MKLKATTGCNMKLDDKGNLFIRPATETGLTLVLGSYIKECKNCYLGKCTTLILDDRVQYSSFTVAGSIFSSIVDMSLLSDKNIWLILRNSTVVFLNSYGSFKDTLGRLAYYYFVLYIGSNFVTQYSTFIFEFLESHPVSGVFVSNRSDVRYLKFTDDFKFPDGFIRESCINTYLDTSDMSVRGIFDLCILLLGSDETKTKLIYTANISRYNLIRALYKLSLNRYTSSTGFDVKLINPVMDFLWGNFDYYAPYFVMTKESVDLLDSYTMQGITNLAYNIGTTATSRAYIRVLLNMGKLFDSVNVYPLFNKFRAIKRVM